MLSLYVIALSLIPNVLDLKPFQSQILLACSIVLSVFVIFTSLIDGTQNFYHQGELIHQCARKIATVHHGLKNIDTEASYEEALKGLEGYQERYRQALDECPINHDNVDYIREMGWKPHLFPDNYPKIKWMTPWVATWFKVRATFQSYSWTNVHLVAFAVITVIVYVFVIRGATPRLT